MNSAQDFFAQAVDHMDFLSCRNRGPGDGFPTDLECVMSLWWLAPEAGAGEAAVEDVGAVLELA